jgi:hypothetical protein
VTRANPFAKKDRQKTNAAPASHRCRIVSLNSLLAVPPLRSGEPTVPVRQRSLGVPHLPELAAEARFRRIAFPQPKRWPAVQPAQRAGRGGGRSARATGTHSRAFPISPGNSPSRIASCHQRHRNRRLTSLESFNVFAVEHSAGKRCHPQQKSFSHLCRNCGRCDFLVEA